MNVLIFIELLLRVIHEGSVGVIEEGPVRENLLISAGDCFEKSFALAFFTGEPKAGVTVVI